LKASRKTRLLVVNLTLSLAGIALVIPNASAELYKYVNEDGVTVLDSHVPARYVKNGYSILRMDGRVLEVVPRALSDREIRERDAELAEQRALEKAEREQKIADQNLMRIYGGPEDVVRARDTKLASIEGFINTSRGNLARLEGQKRTLESQLADIERAGGTISKDRLAQVRSVESRIRSNEAEIEEKMEEMDQLRANFSADLKRVRELYETRSVTRN
jgi:hypothetical protein